MIAKRRKKDAQERKNICFPNEFKITTVEEAIDVLKKSFNSEIFGFKFPAILWKHQCYTLITNRTLVDKSLDKLSKEGIIRFMKLGTTVNDNETALVFFQDYVHYIKQMGENVVVDSFIDKVLKVNPSTSYSTQELENNGFNQDQLTQLVRIGILAVHRKAGNWLLSIPNCGQFYKKFVAGRKALMSVIQKAKFREISKNELENRNLSKKVELGIEYHIYDLIGSDAVLSIESPTGTLLRLPN